MEPSKYDFYDFLICCQIEDLIDKAATFLNKNWSEIDFFDKFCKKYILLGVYGLFLAAEHA